MPRKALMQEGYDTTTIEEAKGISRVEHLVKMAGLRVSQSLEATHETAQLVM